MLDLLDEISLSTGGLLNYNIGINFTGAELQGMIFQAQLYNLYSKDISCA